MIISVCLDLFYNSRTTPSPSFRTQKIPNGRGCKWITYSVCTYDHGPVVSDFGNWCDESDLYLNVSKTTFPLILGKKALNSSPLLFTMKLLTILNMFEW